jgi:hypothetical protein
VRAPIKSVRPVRCGSPVLPTRRQELFEQAKENTLNFLVPGRKHTYRKRALKKMYKWWEDEIGLEAQKRRHRKIQFKVQLKHTGGTGGTDGTGRTFDKSARLATRDLGPY